MRVAAKLLFAPVLLLPLLSGCGGDEPAGSTVVGNGSQGSASDVEKRPHDADRGDTMFMAINGDADGFLAVVNETVTGSMVMDLITPTPTRSTFEDGRLGNEPSLAKSWDWNPDGKTLTFHLRHDVKWDDGVPITAHDYVFTYDLIRDPIVASPRGPYTERMEADTPTAPDDWTVVFRFKWPYNRDTMMSHAGLNVVPKHILEKADRARLRAHEMHKGVPIGHGPFRLLSWKKNQEIVIVRNPKCVTYPVPYLRRIVFKVIKEYETQLTELKTGKIDFMERVQEKDLAKVRSWGDVRLYERGYRFLDYVAWNQKNALFADKRVRRALTLAINIKELVDTLLKFDGEVHGVQAYSTFTPELGEFYDPNFELLPYAPAEAAKLLAEAGWKDSDGDGILDKDGKKFEFTLATNTGNPRRNDACVLIEGDLKKIGIKVNIELREPVTFFGDLRKKNYEAALGGWSAGLFPDPSDIWQSADAKNPRPFNFTSYSNPEVDKLIEEGLKEPDVKKEAEIWQKVHRLVYDDQPYTFLYWKTVHFAAHKRLRGIEPNVLSVLHNVWDWWVPKAEHKHEF